MKTEDEHSSRDLASSYFPETAKTVDDLMLSEVDRPGKKKTDQIGQVGEDSLVTHTTWEVIEQSNLPTEVTGKVLFAQQTLGSSFLLRYRVYK